MSHDIGDTVPRCWDRSAEIEALFSIPVFDWPKTPEGWAKFYSSAREDWQRRLAETQGPEPLDQSRANG